MQGPRKKKEKEKKTGEGEGAILAMDKNVVRIECKFKNRVYATPLLTSSVLKITTN